MHFLFDTIAQDEHALALQWVLERRGHTADLLLLSEFPASQGLTLALSDEAEQFLASHARHPVKNTTYDGCVIRRRRGPMLSSDLAAEDAIFARRQADILTDAVPEFVSNSGLWVNPPDQRLRANNKPAQLKAARGARMAIPDTLISNDPEEILRFVRDHDKVVHKPLQPAVWSGPDGSHLTFTGMVTPEDVLRSGQSLALTPTIFQSYVEKAFEVRAVFMGDCCFAARIEAKRGGVAVVDWRTTYFVGSGLPLAHMTLPQDVHEQCRSIMKALGLVFGCFDFCVRPDGQYVFLEVNPMGQFLWMDRHPKFSMLSTFCDFLESQDPDFRAPTHRDDFRFAAIRDLPGFQERWDRSGQLASAAMPDPFTYADA